MKYEVGVPARGTDRGRRDILAAGLATLTGAAFVPAGRAQSPADENAAAQGGIQELLDRQASAWTSGDRTAFMATIDQRNLTWRRIQGEAFGGELMATLRRTRFRVTQVAAKQDGYFKAWLDILPTGATDPFLQAVWVFRLAEQGWLHSEILNEEIGPRRTRDTEHFRLSHYAWDDDVVDRIGAVLERAYAKAVGRLGSAPDFLAVASVNPTYGAHSGLRGVGTWAAYSSQAKNTILLRSLESFGAGFNAPGEAPEERLLIAVTHEYAHLINDQIVPLVKMRPWMVEGLAELVAEHLRADILAAALRAGRAPTLDRASDVIEYAGSDPARGFSGADVNLAYAAAAHGAACFVEQYGLEAFFHLALAFAETRRWEESFAAVAGQPWAQFERQWVEWARNRLQI